MATRPSRRSFLKSAGLGAAMWGLTSTAVADEQQKIQGFEEAAQKEDPSKTWQAVSDRKIRMGIVGFGVCRFGSQFSLQNHPNVEVVAVSDLFPDRCQALAQECQCSKTYPSLEEMVKDDSIEAIFVATDAPSHAATAWKCSSTASTSPRPFPPSGSTWKRPTSSMKRSRLPV